MYVEGLERGAEANVDERRMVGHYWLRAPELDRPEVVGAPAPCSSDQPALARGDRAGRRDACRGPPAARGERPRCVRLDLEQASREIADAALRDVRVGPGPGRGVIDRSSNDIGIGFDEAQLENAIIAGAVAQKIRQPDD